MQHWKRTDGAALEAVTKGWGAVLSPTVSAAWAAPLVSVRDSARDRTSARHSTRDGSGADTRTLSGSARSLVKERVGESAATLGGDHATTVEKSSLADFTLASASCQWSAPPAKRFLEIIIGAGGGMRVEVRTTVGWSAHCLNHSAAPPYPNPIPDP